VIPAVDVLDGRVVRLAQGRREAVTIEGGDPVELARRFAAEGATRLHLVDLDGAFTGTPSLALLERIASTSGLPLQVGGGYRSIEALAAALAAGADRVMAGTAALTPGFLEEAAERFGDGLVVAIDVRDERVAVDGWRRESELTAAELARRCAEAGVARLLVTSTARDGSLAGPDLDLLAQVVPFRLPVVAAGGIASTQDLVELRDLGCESAVAGSALLGGRFTLAEARAALV
jgi:phosphoribosylformimino-5-aminoimidazole carboxamide ribotide isomerase